MKKDNRSAVGIPDELLEKFKKQSDPGPEPEEGTGAGPDPGAAAASDLEILESLNETLSWVCQTGDQLAKDRGYPGLGEVPPGQLGDLLTIVAKRNLPGSVIEKSPETAAVAILAGIGFQNYLAYKKQINQQPQKKEDKSE